MPAPEIVRGPHRDDSTTPNGGAPVAFWSRSPAELLGELDSSELGLTADEASRRLQIAGPNALQPAARHPTLRLLALQARSPIAILLLTAAVLSAFLGEGVDAAIILVILVGSAFLGFWQERQATNVVEGLLAMIQTTVRLRRGGIGVDVPLEDVVPGDVVVLNAGDIVPADCLLLDAKDLDVDEAALTGESLPASKEAAILPADTQLGHRRNSVFQGTHVISGTATALAISTGTHTVFGGLARDLERRRPDSGFERGVRRFGYLLLQITMFLVLTVFGINVWLRRPVLDAFMFSLALAVGLTPQLLPAIVSVTLAHGARRMARRQVVVRRLVAIEDFGAMRILCTDKTGTLTEGTARITGAFDARGNPSPRTHRLAFLNAALQSGFENPIDTALRSNPPCALGDARKVDEAPYDFARRKLSVLLDDGVAGRILVTKGAIPEVLAACVGAEGEDATTVWRTSVEALVSRLNADGIRCIGVAVRAMAGATGVTRTDEREMTFVGVLALSDPPKEGVGESLDRLRKMGITVKMVTGDGRAVAAAVARQVGLATETIVTGAELDRLAGAALLLRAQTADVFAELDPPQKERLISALRAGGEGIGYLGDGINDAGALHAADVGISVDTAVDVTRRAADVVLLRKDLGVLADGVSEGRRAFANTLKYVFVTTSASFGNMFSMAGASLFSTFLPMLPKQILLLNLLSDLPAMAIATDRLDPELVDHPRRWDVPLIRDFMITFGLISSVFDLLTFGLLRTLAVPTAQFRTAWFVESVFTEILVLLVIRTARPFYRSPPSASLMWATAGVGIVTLALPYLPGAALLDFAPMSAGLVGAMLALTVLLLLACEGAKRVFFRRHPTSRAIGAPYRTALMGDGA